MRSLILIFLFFIAFNQSYACIEDIHHSQAQTEISSDQKIIDAYKDRVAKEKGKKPKNYFHYYMGEDLTNNRLPYADVTFFLGRGTFGEVYRQYYSEGKTKVIKVYNTNLYPNGDMVDIPKRIDADIQTYEFLEQTFKKLSIENIRIPKVKKGEKPETLEIEDIPGINFYSFLVDERNDIDLEVKLAMLRQYKEASNKLVKHLESLGRTKRLHQVHSFTIFGRNREKAKVELERIDFAGQTHNWNDDDFISTKPNNFIVDSRDLSIYMADPG
ncbi:MAG: hypothetical protein ACPGJV_08350 [Bacteriovoracaceae bacterium]